MSEEPTIISCLFDISLFLSVIACQICENKGACGYCPVNTRWYAVRDIVARREKHEH